jgi:hypothetical protein
MLAKPNVKITIVADNVDPSEPWKSEKVKRVGMGIVFEENYIICPFHCVENATDITVSGHRAEMVHRIEHMDMAILEYDDYFDECDHTFLPILPAVSSKITVYGEDRRLSYSSYKWRGIDKFGIQIDGYYPTGCSGTALLDGKIIYGMMVYGNDRYSYAIPSHQIVHYISNFKGNNLFDFRTLKCVFATDESMQVVYRCPGLYVTRSYNSDILDNDYVVAIDKVPIERDGRIKLFGVNVGVRYYLSTRYVCDVTLYRNEEHITVRVELVPMRKTYCIHPFISRRYLTCANMKLIEANYCSVPVPKSAGKAVVINRAPGKMNGKQLHSINGVRVMGLDTITRELNKRCSSYHFIFKDRSAMITHNSAYNLIDG